MGLEMEDFEPDPEVRARVLECYAGWNDMPLKCDLDPAEHAALKRLMAVAFRYSGQSEKVANFLLSWWDAQECGAFCPTELWGLDRKIAEDVCLIFSAISQMARYPDSLGYKEQFDRLARRWRPQLFANDKSEG